MDYVLKRWAAFTRFLDDRRICLTNNAAERGLRGIALGRKSWLLAGFDRGGERAAVMYALIQTARLNDIDPQAWLAMCWPASMITRSPILPRCCHGVGPRTWSVVSWQHECRHHCPAQDHLIARLKITSGGLRIIHCA